MVLSQQSPNILTHSAIPNSRQYFLQESVMVQKEAPLVLVVITVGAEKVISGDVIIDLDLGE